MSGWEQLGAFIICLLFAWLWLKLWTDVADNWGRSRRDERDRERDA